ncbi:MAG TPA: serine/threonine-protein kinase [Polyangiaceae bacterium]|nr:serine/threonine-protein kinase [Polyangiaceae bacterium]
MVDIVHPSSNDSRVIAATYRLIERLGGGAMGEVYAAEHLRTGRQVALKLLRSDLGGDGRAVRRFDREVRALAAMDSEYVVSILDCGTSEEGVPYLVMERLLGEDLRGLLDRTERLPLRRALYLALDACRGLRAAHASGLVHRDLKPANLFVTRRENGEELCKILDFGVAKLDSSAATHQGTVIGTVRYMAPEQLTDGANAGPRCDIYSLGAILYECLTGVAPHSGDTVQELMFNIVNHDVPPATNHVSELPAEIHRILERALARDPSRRFASAEAMLSSLEALLPESAQSRSELDPTGTYDLPHRAPDGESLRLVRLRPSTALAGSLGLVLVSLAAGFVLSRALHAPEETRFVARGIEKALVPAHVPSVQATPAKRMSHEPLPPRLEAPSSSSSPTLSPAASGSLREPRAFTRGTFIPAPGKLASDRSVLGAPRPAAQFVGTLAPTDEIVKRSPATESPEPAPARSSAATPRKHDPQDEGFYSERE